MRRNQSLRVITRHSYWNVGSPGCSMPTSVNRSIFRSPPSYPLCFFLAQAPGATTCIAASYSREFSLFSDSHLYLGCASRRALYIVNEVPLPTGAYQMYMGGIAAVYSVRLLCHTPNIYSILLMVPRLFKLLPCSS